MKGSKMKHQDLIGKKFGRLTVLEIQKKQLYKQNGTKNGSMYYCVCKCDCGNIKTVELSHITQSGRKIISCGCAAKEYAESLKSKGFIGKKYNRLTIIKEVENKKGKRYVLCKCDCGKEKEINLSNVIRGISKSCGCASVEAVKKHFITHGMTHSKIYFVWCGIKRRCYNKNCRNYKDYGGRGIEMYNEWLGDNGFINFYNWALKNGYDKTKNGKECSIDRIDVNGNYCPENCRFITIQEQSRNRRDTIYVFCDGKKETLKGACEKKCIKYTKAYYEIVKMGRCYCDLTIYKKNASLKV